MACVVYTVLVDLLHQSLIHCRGVYSKVAYCRFYGMYVVSQFEAIVIPVLRFPKNLLITVVLIVRTKTLHICGTVVRPANGILPSITLSSQYVILHRGLI